MQKKLRNAVNNGIIKSKEAIEIIHKSNKFNPSWLSNQQPNCNLIKEYYSEVTKETLVDKLPGKAARFSIFTQPRYSC